MKSFFIIDKSTVDFIFTILIRQCCVVFLGATPQATSAVGWSSTSNASKWAESEQGLLPGLKSSTLWLKSSTLGLKASTVARG